MTTSYTSGGGSPDAGGAAWLGEYLISARFAWLVAALLVACLFIVALPVRFAQLRTVCLGTSCGEDQLTPAALTTLRDHGLSPELRAVWTLALESLSALLGLVLSTLIVRRRPGDSMALFTAFFLLTWGMTLNGPLLESLSASNPLWSLPVDLIQLTGGICLGLFAYTFPNGRFAPRWTRWMVPAWALFLVPVTLLPSTSPLSVDRWPPVLMFAVFLAFFGVGVLAQVHHFRHVSSPIERQQTKWVVLGVTSAFCVFSALLLLAALAPGLHRAGTVSELVGNTLVYAGMLLIPLSIGFAILRYRLFDIDLIVNRALVYIALSAAVVGLYVLVVGSLGTLLEAEGNLLVSLVGAGIVAVLFQPLRLWLQRNVNRLMYGERDEPYIVLSRLARRLETTLAPDTVLPTIVGTVREALNLPYAAIALSPSGAGQIVAASGKPVGAPLRLPLIFQGEPVGGLLVSARTADDAFSSADRRLLDDLAHHAGAAVHGVRLTADLQRLSTDLQRSRERLVLAREEERRRLRRDLHDDLAPTLAALALTAETAGDLISADPEHAATLIAELHTGLRAAVADVRRLAYDLRPPALDEVGLLTAVRERAAQFDRREGLTVRVDAPDHLPMLPAAVEVAAYRIVQEGLMNVVRHSGARSCRIRLALGETLEIEIHDDGVGLPETVTRGVGLASMRERAAELGGDCRIEQRPEGGTQVLAQLPIGKE